MSRLGELALRPFKVSRSRCEALLEPGETIVLAAWARGKSYPSGTVADGRIFLTQSRIIWLQGWKPFWTNAGGPRWYKGTVDIPLSTIRRVFRDSSLLNIETQEENWQILIHRHLWMTMFSPGQGTLTWANRIEGLRRLGEFSWVAERDKNSLTERGARRRSVQRRSVSYLLFSWIATGLGLAIFSWLVDAPLEAWLLGGGFWGVAIAANLWRLRHLG